MITETTLKEKLKKYFGHEDFRPGQKALIDAILAGRDVLGIMPTGGGKSVCYQLPALLTEGITLVISPLISLMKDQIHSLKENGIAAAYINSTLTDAQICAVLARAQAGAYKIVYVAPERLLSPRFTDFCLRAEIPLVAVDEAHCVSQWGQDFRPSYAAIPEFIARLPRRPVVAAFTATATERVREDIVSILRLRDHVREVSGFDRENLFFEVRHPQKRYDELVKILKERPGRYGIVYCATRKEVERVCEKLRADGFNARRYHAGLSDDERHSNQDDFIYDKVNVIVATNAFGMGIDKSNVSFVVHYNMPKDLESYYQEAGRAGRDGMPADCLLLYNGRDYRTDLYLIENGEGRQYGSEEQKAFLQEQERRRLKEVDLYCHTRSCLRNYILKYFGETPAADCGRCGNCLSATVDVDVTVTAQKLLSCVVRMGGNYGKLTVIDVLRGSKNAKLARLGLDRLPTYGICTESADELKEIVNFLVEHEYLAMTNGQYPLLQAGPRAAEILTEKRPVIMPRAARPRRGSADGNADGPQNADLFARLKKLRKRLADEHGVPAYVVFHDKTLQEMSDKLPGSAAAFAALPGVGARKCENYGELFLAEIAAFARENGLTVADESALRDGGARAAYAACDFSAFEATDEPLQANALAARLSACTEAAGLKKISGICLNDWLTREGLLASERDGEKKLTRKITALGKSYGIIEELRTDFHGRTYRALLYPPEVQRFLRDNAADILAFRDDPKDVKDGLR